VGLPLLVVDGLTKRYGDRTVLDHLTLTVERGETLVIIGGSGSGKSTLARHLVALERPTEGHIYLDGVDLTALGELALTRVRRRFAMVFQHGALLDSLTVFENVAFPLREETDLDEAEIRERVLLHLRELGVEDAADRLPGELSGGMRKRVGIARAMVTEPEILVYDEPTSGLDPITSRVVDGLIEQMRERFFVTSIVITHDMATAFEIADRVALLDSGRIVTERRPEELFTSNDELVRRFALSSGVDPSLLVRRRHGRKPPEAIRAAWAATHAAASAGP
jgi:phospholipid/cholesterol/gamma-HCH transport system ATP-binding protein